MFGNYQLRTDSIFGNATNTATTNPMKDFEVILPPTDTVSAMKFSPATVATNYLVASSWDCSVRCWEVGDTEVVLKQIKNMTEPVFDVCWADDGSRVFIASCNKQAYCWDLASDQIVQVAQHDAAVKTCHWVKGSNYTCLMSGSWDKTLKFWDTRSSSPMMVIDLPERCYCADVDYPMAVVGTAGRGLIVYSLENQPTEYNRPESRLPQQHQTVAIFKNKNTPAVPTGFAYGGIEGRVAIHCVNSVLSTDNFSFKCHRVNEQDGSVSIYAVNDIAVHPIHGTLATVGSDGTFGFWDKDTRTKLHKFPVTMEQSITKCCFNSNGQIFAYAVGYDWSKGYEYYDPFKKTSIFLRPCFDELKPRS